MRGLYLHIPFCEKKCIYCDFYSLETTHLISEFVETLLMEIDLRAAKMLDAHKYFDTVFFGGGTPSLLSPAQMERIITRLRDHFTFESGAEWTMECNPGTVTATSLTGYRALGMNRLSYGVQSFFASDLQFLSRIHSKSEAIDAIKLSREAGFENVNLDLMFALPNQTFEHWKANLDIAVSLHTDHISAYSLIFEPGTPLHTMLQQGKVRKQDEERDVEMYDYAISFLAQHGYEQYEVSNFAKQGAKGVQYCLHNCIYWQGDEYVSLGPSAHGYIAGTRYWNARSLKRYTDTVRSGALPITNSETLTEKERMFERAFLELRARGIRKPDFMRDFGVLLDTALAPILHDFERDGLLKNATDRITLTPKGYAVCDAITLEAITLLEKHVGEAWKECEISLVEDE
jgi:oxygen-independent coproporphyrinogen III oxidase